MSNAYRLFTSLLLIYNLAPGLRAQVERASIVGKITDKTGASMAGVVVTVTNESTNTSVPVSTDDSGAYTAVNLIPGSYAVNATRSGFRPVVFRNFVLQVGQSARLDQTLTNGLIRRLLPRHRPLRGERWDGTR